MSEKARRQYPGVVKNQQIVGSQQLGEVAKHEVVEAIITATEVQQPRSRPVRQRILGDQFLRQAIVEIGDQHTAIMPDRTDGLLADSYSLFCGFRFLR